MTTAVMEREDARPKVAAFLRTPPGQVFTHIVQSTPFPATTDDFSWLMARVLQGYSSEDPGSGLTALQQAFGARIVTSHLDARTEPQEAPEAPGYRPPMILRRIARRWPFFDWLCYLPPSERAFYTTGETGRWVRENLADALPQWAWDVLVDPEARD